MALNRINKRILKLWFPRKSNLWARLVNFWTFSTTSCLFQKLANFESWTENKTYISKTLLVLRLKAIYNWNIY